MTKQQVKKNLGELLAAYAGLCERDLDIWLLEADVPDALAEAMRYCALGGGKRLRPAIVYMAAEATGADANAEIVRRSAVAVELIHSYSLVHDDLPAMDNDTLRRGQPTAHVKFGEAMAILAGDALLTRAFGILAEADHPMSARLVSELAAAAGAKGMIAGQVADMGLCDLPAGPEGTRYIHLTKTAAIITAAARMGAICGQASAEELQAVTRYAMNIGLLFQMVDDLLDVTGNVEHLGKTPGKDVSTGKRTHVADVGIARSIAMCEELTDAAARAIRPLGKKADKLKMLATLLAERTY